MTSSINPPERFFDWTKTQVQAHWTHELQTVEDLKGVQRAYKDITLSCWQWYKYHLHKQGPILFDLIVKSILENFFTDISLHDFLYDERTIQKLCSVDQRFHQLVKRFFNGPDEQTLRTVHRKIVSLDTADDVVEEADEQNADLLRDSSRSLEEILEELREIHFDETLDAWDLARLESTVRDSTAASVARINALIPDEASLDAATDVPQRSPTITSAHSALNESSESEATTIDELIQKLLRLSGKTDLHELCNKTLEYRGRFDRWKTTVYDKLSRSEQELLKQIPKLKEKIQLHSSRYPELLMFSYTSEPTEQDKKGDISVAISSLSDRKPSPSRAASPKSASSSSACSSSKSSSSRRLLSRKPTTPRRTKKSPTSRAASPKSASSSSACSSSKSSSSRRPLSRKPTTPRRSRKSPTSRAASPTSSTEFQLPYASDENPLEPTRTTEQLIRILLKNSSATSEEGLLSQLRTEKPYLRSWIKHTFNPLSLVEQNLLRERIPALNDLLSKHENLIKPKQTSSGSTTATSTDESSSPSSPATSSHTKPPSSAAVSPTKSRRSPSSTRGSSSNLPPKPPRIPRKKSGTANVPVPLRHQYYPSPSTQRTAASHRAPKKPEVKNKR